MLSTLSILAVLFRRIMNIV